MRRFFSTALAFASVPFFTGCADYAFVEQDVSVRFAESSKTIYLELETRGLHASDRRWGESADAAEARAIARVEQVADGRRYVQLLGWPLVADLDAYLEEAAALESQDQDENSKEPFELLKTLDRLVSVEAAAFVDGAGDAGLRQLFTVTDAPSALAALNGLISMAVREELQSTQARSGSDPENPIDEPYESQRSRDNLRAFLDAGEPWITLDEDWLSVRAPLTPEDLALILRGFASDLDAALASDQGNAPGALRDSARMLDAILGGLAQIRIDDNIASLRWRVGRDGTVRFRYRGERSPEVARMGASFAARLQETGASAPTDRKPEPAGRR